MGQEHVSKRTYIVSSRAWYADTAKLPRDIREEVLVRYEKGPGPRSWEFAIRLHDLGLNHDDAFRIEMFDDTWDALVDVPELFRALANRGQDIDMGELEATLTELGFKDVTPETNENPLENAPMHHCSRCGLVETIRVTETELQNGRNGRILTELRGHLSRAEEWAHPSNIVKDSAGWSCVSSTLAAVEEGRVGLALERWNDLEMGKPALSREAEEWRAG